jgi:DDE superfamily endonuclease
LADALLCAPAIPSLADLSLESVHRRGWGSAYAALARGRIDAEQLRDLLARHPLERGLYYHPSRHSAGQPIVAGWAFQWITQLSFARDSWTAPVDSRRLHPLDNHNQVAVAQIHTLLQRLPASGQVPLFVFDAGYDPTGLGLGLADVPAAILVRLRSGRCFYADPPPQPRSVKGGRPRRHGAKLDTRDPSTWPTPSRRHVEDDDQYGRVHVQAWAGLHPKQQLHTTRGTKQLRPIVRGTLVRVQVERVPANTRPPQVLWLWWQGSGTPDLAMLWRAYVRRFDLEHTIRFAKQTLGWATPRPHQYHVPGPGARRSPGDGRADPDRVLPHRLSRPTTPARTAPIGMAAS